MFNNQFSALDNVKMTLPNTSVLKVPSKLLLGKDMFTLNLVEHEYESSVSIWEFTLISIKIMRILEFFCLQVTSI